MFGFNHSHRHPGRDGGPRGGSFRKGPLEMQWSIDGDFPGFGGRGGGRRRVFDGGELRLVLLALLGEQPRHGYDLIREIEERSGGGYAPSPGVVYPTLTMLDELGQIDEVKEEGARRRFQITGAGRAHLDERRAEADALLARLTVLGAARTRGDHAPIRRAMTNLHMALRSAFVNAGGKEADGGERAHAIAAILDEATRKIERL